MRLYFSGGLILTVFRFFVRLLFLLITPYTAWAQSGWNNDAGDRTLVEMERAYARKQSARLTQLLPASSGHPLEVYAAYWELKTRLESASPEEIRSFLSRWQGSYFEDRLRNDWLLLLGQNGDRANFAREYALFRMRDDAEVRCWATRFGVLNAPPQATLDDWYGLKTSSTACDSAAAYLLAQGKITNLDIWRKARFAAEAKQLSAARNAAAIIDPYAAERLRLMLARPQTHLDQGLVSPEIATVLLANLASQDPDLAVISLNAYQIQTQGRERQAQLTPEQSDWAWGVIGRQAAMNLAPTAINYYRNAKKMTGWSDEMLAWRARAALRGGIVSNAPDILSSIAQMSPAAQQDATWVYWRARALASSGRKTEAAQAQQLYRAIASPYGFYEMLALEETGAAIQAPLPPPRPTAAEIEQVRNKPGFARALYAIQMGLRTFGVREWNYTAHLHEEGGLPTRELLAAAELACQYEIWDRCINTSERIKGAFADWQRFPTPHRSEVLANSRAIGIDPAYVYGLIRQESRFVVSARSGVGASGLMQIMPATAQWTARKMGLIGFNPAQLYDTDTNIQIGVSYLNLALERFQSSKPLAAAAYNAGPNRASKWRDGASNLETVIWTENIPFNETRDYVKKVLANTTMYAALLKGQPQSLKSYLGHISPAPMNTRPINADLP